LTSGLERIIILGENYFKNIRKVDISLEFPYEELIREIPVLMVEGYNVFSQTIELNTPIEETQIFIPEISLEAYPNPFNNILTIKFAVPKKGRSCLEIYNILGQKIAKLVDKELQLGLYQQSWNAQGISSGLYLIILVMENKIYSKKVLLLK